MAALRFDPRNYLGFGHLDLVPTKIVPSQFLMTASDDWFSDFNGTGMPTIATGRLPVSTVAEANLVASKVATYEGEATDGSWTSQALMVADYNDTENFTQDSQSVQAKLPAVLQVTDIFASQSTTTQTQRAIVDSINSGQLLVNYDGHGSEDQWSGSDLFDNAAANGLTNGSSLPVFLIMNCLNGFFQDVYAGTARRNFDAGSQRRRGCSPGIQRSEPGDAASNSRSTDREKYIQRFASYAGRFDSARQVDHQQRRRARDLQSSG